MNTTKSLKSMVTAISISSILLMSPMLAFAQTTTVAPTENKGGNLQTVIARGDQYISQRLGTLNALIPSIQNAKKLKPEDKNNFINMINTNISGLTSLKAKIDADTDLPTARTDVQSIFTAFRIYAVFVPATHGLATVDAMSTTASLLNTYEGKLQSKVTEAASQGKNVTNLQSLLTDMLSRISDANTQYSIVESQLSPMTPASYNANPAGVKAVFQTARSEIQTGTQDLKTAWNDAMQIRQGLKALGGVTVTSVPTQ